MEIISELTPEPSDIIIDKNRPSSFIETKLDEIIDDHGIERLVVCCVTTNCCVESTVRDASQYHIDPFIIEDATAEWDNERYEVALRSMNILFGEVFSTEDAVEQIHGQPAVKH
jgi:ureidoacrylate peracid hydrolase